jgi:hypothetical protein
MATQQEGLQPVRASPVPVRQQQQRETNAVSQYIDNVKQAPEALYICLDITFKVRRCQGCRQACTALIAEVDSGRATQFDRPLSIRCSHGAIYVIFLVLG